MKDELRNELLEIVNDINCRYESLSNLSHDRLREKLWKIEIQIANSENQNEALDSHLSEIYAIVKDTARRFSEGDIIVSATSNDIKLANSFDFVKIVGDKAIYRNKWDAGGQPMEWNMIHYDEQLMGGILLHRGFAVEMATGEGKTLVATLPVFLNAITHQGVHVMTVNDYLSKRDYEITRPLYMFYGLSADCIEYYSRNDKRKKDAYLADITFGTNSSFTFDYLFDHLEVTPEECVQQKHNYAIIDELDSILIDDADEPHIVSGGNSYDVSKDYKENLKLIKELIEDSSLYSIDSLTKSSSFTPLGQRWIEKKTGITNLYSFQRTYEIEEFDSLSTEAKEEIGKKLHLQNVFLQLLHALTVYERDIDYLVEGGKVKIIDQHTGRIKENSRWEHGLHTAIEVKEDVDPQKDSDGMAVISLKNYFKLYNKMCGMSGTIMSVEQELSDIYGLKCASLPTHKPCIRVDKPLQIYKTKEEKDVAIVNCILQNINNGQPSLVGSISIKRSELIGNLLTEKGVKFNKLDAKTAKDEAFTVAKAGQGNTITISTSIAGRGTDIKPSQDAIDNGGLVVIGTDLFDSIRVDKQLRGRTGRQGNPGSSVFFVSLDDFILKHLNISDTKKLNNLISNIKDGNYNIPEVRYYFEKAQSNREVYFRNLRKETARKDDIVAPHRFKFYTQRNGILFDNSVSESIISRIIDDSEYTYEDATQHLQELYQKAKELIIRSTWNNNMRQKAYIPFSDALHTFAILFDINFIQSSFEYFSREYKRQIILQVYDKLWKRFVLHMMGNLDKREIEMLDEKYNEMMKEINGILLSRILNATIPFEGRKAVIEEKDESINDANMSAQKTSKTISSDDLCPCGSGKKYSECHGNNIRYVNKIRRRR